MGFQILNSEGKAIPINKLDEEIAMFWGKEVHPKEYATPLHEPKFLSYKESFEFHWRNNNWFDLLGWYIHYDKITTMQSLKDRYIAPFVKIPIDELMQEPTFKKYYNLLDLWIEKGYIPNPVAD